MPPGTVPGVVPGRETGEVDDDPRREPDPDDLDDGDPPEGEGGEAADPTTDERLRRRLGEDRVEFDCAPWAGESRALLASLLDTEGVEHVWQGTTLTVHAGDAEFVDGLVDEVQAVATPSLAATAPRVVYEVGSWPVAFQTTLADALTAAELPYEWDESGDLVVYEEHEEEVEAILEALPDPEESDEVISADDGLVVHRVLDRVHAAATRLARDPQDPRAVLALDEAGAQVELLAAPFGFSSVEWRSFVGLVSEVRDALHATGEDAPADEELVELVEELREVVGGYV